MHARMASDGASSGEAVIGVVDWLSSEGPLTVRLTVSETVNSSNIGSFVTSGPTCVASGHDVSVNGSG